MRTLANMSETELAAYMQLLGQATATIIPPDGMFCLIVFDENQKANYVSSCNRLQIPSALREIADGLEAKMSETN